MVRVCDGRMSGTAYGTVVLHVAPEAAAGGPLACSATGDLSCSTSPRDASTSTSRRRVGRRASPAPAAAAAYAAPTRGWERLYVDHVRQADTGADLDFLVGGSGDSVTRESH